MAIERDGDALYLVLEGARYRVHDAAFGPPLAKPGHHKVLPLESDQANTRYFVDALKVVRAHSFKRIEPRRISEELHRGPREGRSPPDDWG